MDNESYKLICDEISCDPLETILNSENLKDSFEIIRKVKNIARQYQHFGDNVSCKIKLIHTNKKKIAQKLLICLLKIAASKWKEDLVDAEFKTMVLKESNLSEVIITNDNILKVI